MQLTPAQKQIARDTHRFRVVNCGRRFGKTILATEEMIALGLHKEARIAYIAPTYQQARDIAWEQLKRRLREVEPEINESRLEIRFKNIQGTYSTVVLRGWESIETLRGQSYDFVVLDEVASMRYFWEGWQEVIRPTLTDRKGGAMFISTPKGFNHFYELYNKESDDKQFKSFHFTSYDNPNIPPEEVDEAKNQLTEDRFAQEYLADFRKQEGLVYKEFQRSRHVYSEANIDEAEVLAGIDFGFTNPTCVLTVIRDRDNRYWVTNELYRTGMTNDALAEYVASQQYDKVYPDPASPEAIKHLADKHVNVYEVSKGKDSIVLGINKVRELFKQNRIKIHESCKNLIWELETYSYPEKRADNNESEVPIKENDHACFTKDTKIEIPVGEQLHQVSTGIHDVYEFLGSKVTADHPYLTQRGFVRLDDLRYTDSIIVWKNKSLTELHLGDTRTPRAVSLKTILYLLQRNVLAIKLNVSTGIYGKNTMAKYLGAFISTIKTVTQLTTTYLTSKWSVLNSTTPYITKKTSPSGEEVWILLESMRYCGTNQKRVKSFIACSLKLLGSIKNGIRKVAKSVTKITKRRSQQDLNTATIIAKLKHCGKEEVFATTTTSGFFTANGVLVSNCDSLRYVIMTNVPIDFTRQRELSHRVIMNRNRNRNQAL